MPQKSLDNECKCDSLPAAVCTPCGCGLLQAGYRIYRGSLSSELWNKCDPTQHSYKAVKEGSIMYTKECINCLCNFCDRTECRYKASNSNVCEVRCYDIQTTVKVHYKPVLCCDKFRHGTVHKVFKVKRKARTIDDVLKTMSAADFLNVLGGGKRD